MLPRELGSLMETAPVRGIVLWHLHIQRHLPLGRSAYISVKICTINFEVFFPNNMQICVSVHTLLSPLPAWELPINLRIWFPYC